MDGLGEWTVQRRASGEAWFSAVHLRIRIALHRLHAEHLLQAVLQSALLDRSDLAQLVKIHPVAVLLRLAKLFADPIAILLAAAHAALDLGPHVVAGYREGARGDGVRLQRSHALLAPADDQLVRSGVDHVRRLRQDVLAVERQQRRVLADNLLQVLVARVERKFQPAFSFLAGVAALVESRVFRRQKQGDRSLDACDTAGPRRHTVDQSRDAVVGHADGLVVAARLCARPLDKLGELAELEIERGALLGLQPVLERRRSHEKGRVPRAQLALWILAHTRVLPHCENVVVRPLVSALHHAARRRVVHLVALVLDALPDGIELLLLRLIQTVTAFRRRGVDESVHPCVCRGHAASSPPVLRNLCALLGLGVVVVGKGAVLLFVALQAHGVLHRAAVNANTDPLAHVVLKHSAAAIGVAADLLAPGAAHARARRVLRHDGRLAELIVHLPIVLVAVEDDPLLTLLPLVC
mmetsp:Transcript_21232/g.36376  ORF Transcript_21232/g.36376 Transcript_21232/m.36376 type:complete len:467 (-) Transcript_21232:244-1644(-)